MKRVLENNENKQKRQKTVLKVVNPQTKREIDVGGASFQKLLKTGCYTYDNNHNCFIEVKQILTVKSKAKPRVVLRPSLKDDTISGIHILQSLDKNIDKIAHISDVHIPTNLHVSGYHQYKQIFSKLYLQLEELKQESAQLVIVVTGDLVHTKLDVQNETNLMARNFLASLGEIAPTIVIIGNHDFLQNNPERLDSLTVLSDRLPNVFPLKLSGLYELGGILFVFSSLFDNMFISAETARFFNIKKLPMYKLFHGTVQGSFNCNGRQNNKSHELYEMLHPNDFIGFDAVLLGHIHKRQKLICPDVEIVYAGSLMQQNFGESTHEHGFVVWTTDNHKSTFVDIENDYAMLNLHVEHGVLTEISQKILDEHKSKMLSLKCHCKQTSHEEYEMFKENMKKTYNVKSCRLAASLSHTIVRNNLGTTKNDMKESLSEFTNQMELEYFLIREHSLLQDDESLLQLQELHLKIVSTVCKIDNNASLISTTNETVAQWHPLHMTFCNVLRYGNDHENKILFDNGVYSLTANNKAGKTSLLCIFLFGLFGKISKTDSPQRNEILHNGTKSGFIEICFVHDSNVYCILRNLTKGTNGVTKVSTKFWRLDDDVNNSKSSITTTSLQDGQKTQNEINKFIGEFEPFLLLHIISKQLSEPLLYMTAGEKYKHLLQLCQIDHYVNYYQECYKNYVKVAEEEQKTLDAQIRVQEVFVKKDHVQPNVSFSEQTLQCLKTTLQEHNVCRNILKKEIDELQARESVLRERLRHLCEKDNIDLIEFVNKILQGKEETEHEIAKFTNCYPNFQLDEQNLETWNYACVTITLNNLRQLDNDFVLNTWESQQQLADILKSKMSFTAAPNMTYDDIMHQRTQCLTKIERYPDILLWDKCKCENMLKLNSDHLLQPRNVIFSRLSAIEARKQQIETMDNMKNQDSSENIINTMLNRLNEKKIRVVQNPFSTDVTEIENILKSLCWKNDVTKTNISWECYQKFVTFVENIKCGNYQEYQIQNEDIKLAEKRFAEYQCLVLEDEQLRIALKTHYVHMRLEMFQFDDDLQWFNDKKTYDDLIVIINRKKQIETYTTIQNLFQIQHRYKCLVIVKELHIICDSLMDLRKRLLQDDQEICSIQEKLISQSQHLKVTQNVQIDIENLQKQKKLVDKRLMIYKEYTRLMDKGGIPLALLQIKMTQFKDRVNHIFEKYTQYNFSLKYDQKKTGTIRFDITHRDTNIDMEPSRICGFESVVLLLAINYAALTLSARPQCGFLIIDESLDCVDQTRLIEDVPEILEVIKSFYQTLVIISHRDIPHSVVDKNLQIHVFDKYSTLNSD